MMLFFIFSVSLLVYKVNCDVLDYVEYDEYPFSTVLLKNQYLRQPSWYQKGYNDPCRATIDGESVQGFCRTHLECTLLGGRIGSDSQCGYFLPCCLPPKTCGQTTNKRTSIFSGESQRDTAAVPCTYGVKLTNGNICQIKLDFDEFQLAPPRQSPNEKNVVKCIDDYLMLDSTLVKIPKLCGYNTGQHLYIPVNASQNINELNFYVILSKGTANDTNLNLPPPKWKITITQLECPGRNFVFNSNAVNDAPLIAPPGCLQYFTEPRGEIKSFGYNPSLSQNNKYAVGQQYSMCFKSFGINCGIEFTTKFFKLSGGLKPKDYQCSDYLYIPQAKTSAKLNALVQFCGNSFSQNDTISSTPVGPMYVNFITNDETMGDTEQGFHMSYKIKPTGCLDDVTIQ